MSLNDSGGNRRRHKYTEEQNRFLWNWNDLCISKHRDFKTSVVSVFNQKWNTNLTEAALFCKFSYLSQKMSKSWAGIVWENGTKCLDLRTLNMKTKGIWNEERELLGLPPLGQRIAANAIQQAKTHRPKRLRSSHQTAPFQGIYDTDSTTNDSFEATSNNDRETTPSEPHLNVRRNGKVMVSIPQPKRMMNSNTPSVPANAIAVAEKYSSDQTKRLSGIISWLLVRCERYITMPAAELDLIDGFRKEILMNLDNPMENLLKDYTAVQANLVKYENTVRDLVGPFATKYPPPFPISPSILDIDSAWDSIRGDIFWSIPTKKDVTLVSINTFIKASELTELLLSDRMSLKEFVNWQTSQFPATLMQESVLQIVAVLVCYFIFKDHELLFDGQHTETLAELYELIYSSWGPEATRRLSLCVTKRRIECSHFQDFAIPAASVKVSQRIASILGEICGRKMEIGCVNTFRDWCEKAIRLKTKLLISRFDYDLWFCSPDDAFDERLMVAKDTNGMPIPSSECKGKEVTLCLFPAIIQYAASPMIMVPDGDVTTLYATRKSFFRSRGKTFDEKNEEVASKAVVMVN